MNRKMIIVLCSLIAVMTVIIVAGVSYLYNGVGVPARAETVTVADAADTSETVAPKPAEVPHPAVAPKVHSLPQEFKVTNCSTHKQNTLRQNNDKSLELIDETGKSLWSVPFPGVVCGAVGEVDYYDNKKIQFLLCDGSSLHLIDRLGREVRGFPKSVGFVVVGGPEKILHKGVTYWRLDTQGNPVHYDYKATKQFVQLP